MIIKIVLAITIVIAVYTDLKYRKIYNYLTFPAAISGIGLSFFAGGYDGFRSSLIGFGLGLALLLPLFLLGGIGGGDVKFLAAVGALGGFPYVLWSAVYMAIIGGTMAAIGMIAQHRFKQTARDVKNFLSSIFVFFFIPESDIYLPGGQLNVTLPYGVAIGLGAAVAMLVRF